MFLKRYCLPVFLLGAILMLALAPAYAQDDTKDVYGRALPADAAPYSMQIEQELCNSTRQETSLSSVVTVYARICDQNGFDKFGDSLVTLDENLNVGPAAAEKWEVGSDGLTWTFHLKPGQVWSDGTPLTANDYVASYRFMADPKHGYDFSWLWLGIIKNWSEAVAGEVPPDQIGMSQVDDNTLQVVTAAPAPYLPLTLFFWAPLQAKALAASGPDYIIDPAKSVSSGPFMLKSFTPGKELILEANPTYNGYRKPWLKEIRGVYGDEPNGSFSAFQNHDVDKVNYANMSTADLKVVAADPVMSKNYRPNFGDFRTDYLLFDTFNKPFSDVKVRLAFAKAIDRQSIVDKVIGSNLALPAVSFLAPGFPASDTKGDFKDIQGYDCPAAQKLLSDAGYAGGNGFPAVELKLRGESDSWATRYTAVAASISNCLNVKVTVNNMEYKSYMDALNAKPTGVQFGAISYGMDFLDPANMLGVFVFGGRHSWNNPDYDKLVKDASALVGDPAKRADMFHEAEKILVSDVGGAFIDFRIQGDLFQPYFAAPNCFKPDAQGVGAWHWGNDGCWGDIYITKDVMNVTSFRNK